ncbi:DUF5133 domain-containing protein [Streptomyces sp. NRRL B-3648]|uniref:DUF5133 domain-containing protein n=1 Tax=Streptomyces sp. NRRL B-3648 TaxID=1519493 RepID=UPI00099C137D|nr:DUF5133 domain-containing protein [Streptomyces sp. NRRL B-3648]
MIVAHPSLLRESVERCERLRRRSTSEGGAETARQLEDTAHTLCAVTGTRQLDTALFVGRRQMVEAMTRHWLSTPDSEGAVFRTLPPHRAPLPLTHASEPGSPLAGSGPYLPERETLALVHVLHLPNHFVEARHGPSVRARYRSVDHHPVITQGPRGTRSSMGCQARALRGVAPPHDQHNGPREAIT